MQTLPRVSVWPARDCFRKFLWSLDDKVYFQPSCYGTSWHSVRLRKQSGCSDSTQLWFWQWLVHRTLEMKNETSPDQWLVNFQSQTLYKQENCQLKQQNSMELKSAPEWHATSMVFLVWSRHVQWLAEIDTWGQKSANSCMDPGHRRWFIDSESPRDRQVLCWLLWAQQVFHGLAEPVNVPCKTGIFRDWLNAFTMCWQGILW